MKQKRQFPPEAGVLNLIFKQGLFHFKRSKDGKRSTSKSLICDQLTSRFSFGTVA